MWRLVVSTSARHVGGMGDIPWLASTLHLTREVANFAISLGSRNRVDRLRYLGAAVIYLWE
jgi:hypothetical protein